MNLRTYIFCSSLVAILAREQINKLKPHEIVKKKKNNSQTLQSKKNKDFKSQVTAVQYLTETWCTFSFWISPHGHCKWELCLCCQCIPVTAGASRSFGQHQAQVKPSVTAVTSSSATVLIKKTWYWEAESIDCLQGKGHLGSVSWEQHFHLSVHPAE